MLSELEKMILAFPDKFLQYKQLGVSKHRNEKNVH